MLASAPVDGAAPAATPAWRDPWGWLAAAQVVPVLFAARGAPWGEPAAEDFDFLHRAVLGGGGSWFDGGGSLAFWRPVAHQLYYRLLGGAILESPGAVAALHALLLALAAWLLYRTLRPSWSGPAAALAAGFPLVAESTRTVLCWPTQFVDLGAWLFLALAMHQTSRRKLPATLLALTLALLCKEVAVVGVLLLPLLPGLGGRDRRLRWLAAGGGVAVVWGALYLWVRAHAGLELPHGIERDPNLLATPWWVRLQWALLHCLRAAASLSLTTGPHDRAVIVGAAVLAAASAWRFARDASARARLARMRGWIAWGTAWCALSWGTVASVYPHWQPNRTLIGSTGLGVAVTALAGAAHPALAGAVAAGRIALLGLAPRAPARIPLHPDERGAFMDFTRLARLQRLMRESRLALREARPTLPHGARVAWLSLPPGSEYAFGGAQALQLWYRDSTLVWFGTESEALDRDFPVSALVSYQERFDPQVVVIDAGAVAFKLEGLVQLQHGRWREAIAQLERADSAQHDRRAVVFLGDNAGRRAMAWARLERWDLAAAAARTALAATPEDGDARAVLVWAEAAMGAPVAARAQFDSLRALDPGHASLGALRQVLGSPAEP